MYEPNKKYKVQCRAVLNKDVEVPGSEVERVRKDWAKKFEGRKDITIYFMINEIKDDSG